MKWLKRLTALVLAFGLVAGTGAAGHQHVQAEETAVIENPKTVTDGTNMEGAFDKPAVHWYKFQPTAGEIAKHTHIELKVESDEILNVSFYSSESRAKDDDTFGQYTSASEKGHPAVIEFPYAWEGPYFVKVEYFGDDVGEEGANAANSVQQQTPVETDSASHPASYRLSAKSVTLPPKRDNGMEEDCPVEVSVQNKKGGAELLESIRVFRDGVLAKSAEGKKAASLYYKAAPFLMVKMSSKETREAVYRNLVVLQPLLEDLNKNGSGSTRVISKAEQQAISELFSIVDEAVPSKLRSEIRAFAKKADIANLAGDKASAAAKKAGLKLAPPKAQDRYIIKLKPGKSPSVLQSKPAGDLARSSLASVSKEDRLFDDLYVLEMKGKTLNGMSAQAKSKSISSAVTQIEKLPEVEFIEPVKTYHATSSDVQYPYQWSLLNKGGDTGKKGADIRNEKLQNLLKQRNLKETLIAVVDTGVDSTLADLNGKVRTDLGKNFIDPTESAADDNGHGTHVSGIIAAASGNGYSMAGINQKTRILPVKVLDASGYGDTEQIAYGIKYAVDRGAKVINLSLGGGYSRTIEYVLQYAASKNVTVIAASGNEGDFQVGYPAASKYAISVGATNSLDIVSDYSNYGEGLDVVAPGSDIPSLLPNGNVTYESGTSMAAPHVTAVAGLMLSRNPSMKMADIQTALKTTAVSTTFVDEGNSMEDISEWLDDVKLPIGVDFVSGSGRIDAYSAFSRVDLNARVYPVSDLQRVVTGTAQKGARVEVKKGRTILGKATADAKNTFKVKIPVQKANQLLQVTVTSASGDAQTTIKRYVQKAPAAPKVKTVSNKSVSISGTAPKNTKILIRNAGKKVIAQGKTDKKGNFSIKISKQKAYATLWVSAVDAANLESKLVKVTVQDKIAPAVPKVNKVTIASKAVKGKAEKGATVTVKRGKTKLGTAKANQQGSFTVKISKQKKGAVLSVTAKDKAGNESKPAKVKVSSK